MLETYLVGLALAILNHLSPVNWHRVEQPGWEESAEQRADRYVSIAVDMAVVLNDVCNGNRACAVGATYMLLGVAFHESGFAPDVDLGKCYRGPEGRNARCDGGRAHSMWQLHVSNSPVVLYHSLATATMEMVAWSREVLADQAAYPFGSHADRTFGTRHIRAYVEVHPADATIPQPHRGVSLFEGTKVNPDEEAKLYDTDRREAIRTAFRWLARSLRVCALEPKDNRLASYAGGGGCKLPTAVAKAQELADFIRKARTTNTDDLPSWWE